MGKHRKTSKLSSLWKQCDLCNVYVYEKNMNLHQRLCSGSNTAKDLDLLPHGYIHNGIFHAKVIKMDNKRSALSFPENFRPLVLMHPVTMKTFKFAGGGYVIINNDYDERVYRCWSCKNVPPSCILFPTKFELKQAAKGHAIVQHYIKSAEFADMAVELWLLPKMPTKEFMNSKHFVQYLLKEYDGFFLRAGMTLSVHYLGFLCEFLVTKIWGSTVGCSEFENKSVNSCFKNSVHLDSVNCDSLKFCDNSNAFKYFDASLNISSSEHGYYSFSDDKPAKMCSTPLATKGNFAEVDSLSESFMSQCSIVDNNICETSHQYFVVHVVTHISIEEERQLESRTRETMFFNDIGGMDDQLSALKHLLHAYLSQDALLNDQTLPTGILITGPPSTGKLMICDAIANESHVLCISIKGQDCHKLSVAALSKLRTKFQEAITKAPSILLMCDIDAMYHTGGKEFPNKNPYSVNELLKLIDDLPKCHGRKVVFIATASKPEYLDSALKRPGRLEKEIKLNIPTSFERNEILKKLVANENHTLTDEQITEIVDVTHGYSRGDFVKIFHKSLLKVEMRCHPANESSVLTYDDFLYCLREIKPTLMKGFTTKVEKVQWDEIGGMSEVKQELLDMVDLPLKHPEVFEERGMTPTRGILLFGPPGCSKTMIVNALATRSQLNFISIKQTELLHPYVGESEKAVSNLFKKARASAPSIIFFDEFDSLAASRDSFGGSDVQSRVLAQLLIGIDGIDTMKGVCIIAATNRPDLIDKALLRPGRFDRVIYVPLPDSNARKEILQIKLKKMPISDDVDIVKLVEATNGYSAAEIIDVCREAGMQVVKEVLGKDLSSEHCVLKMAHFIAALKIKTPRITAEKIAFFEKYIAEYCYK